MAHGTVQRRRAVASGISVTAGEAKQNNTNTARGGAGDLPRGVRLYYRLWLAPYLVGALLGLLVALAVLSSGASNAEHAAIMHRTLQQAGGVVEDESYLPYEDDPPAPGQHMPPIRPPDQDLRNVLRTLKFSHLWQDDRYEKYVFGDPQILNQMMIFISATILAYLVVVNILSCFILPFLAPQFRELDIFGQMAVTTNSLYTILLLAQLVPYTVIIIGILFGDCRSKQFPAFYYTVFVFLTTHAIMYAYEGIVRSVIKVNYLLLIHHATFFVFMILEFVNQSNFVVKTCLILDYFVVWEAGLYLTNVCYRLKVNYTLLKWVMIVGTTVHGVTHFLQAMLLTAFFVGMGKRIEAFHINKGVFAFMVIITTALIFYQYYLEKIFYEMWIKVARAHRAKTAAAAKGDVEEGSAELPATNEAQALLKDHLSSSSPGEPTLMSRHSAPLPDSHTRSPFAGRSSVEVEMARITDEERLMLGELPTFPAKMTSFHLPKSASLTRTPGTSAADAQHSQSGTPAAFPSLSPTSATQAPTDAAGVSLTQAKAKKAKDDVLTDDMWAQTED